MTNWDGLGQRGLDHFHYHQMGPYPAHLVDSQMDVAHLWCHLTAASDCVKEVDEDQLRYESGEVVLCPISLPVTYAETGVVIKQRGIRACMELPAAYSQRTVVPVLRLVSGI